jgi:hypothetical protein
MCSQYSSNKMILNFTIYDVRVHNIVDVCTAKSFSDEEDSG